MRRGLWQRVHVYLSSRAVCIFSRRIIYRPNLHFSNIYFLKPTEQCSQGKKSARWLKDQIVRDGGKDRAHDKIHKDS